MIKTITKREHGLRSVATLILSWGATKPKPAAIHALDDHLGRVFGGFTRRKIIGGWEGGTEQGLEWRVVAGGWRAEQVAKMIERAVALYPLCATWCHLDISTAVAHHFKLSDPPRGIPDRGAAPAWKAGKPFPQQTHGERVEARRKVNVSW